MIKSIRTRKKSTGNPQKHNASGKFNFDKVVQVACETTYSDFAYLVSHHRDSSKFEVLATHGMDGVDVKLITLAPLLSSTSNIITNLQIENASTDPRLAKNKIVGLTSTLHMSVTGGNIHVSPSTDFQVNCYHEFRIGETASLVLLDKSEGVVRTNQMIRGVEAICELIARELMMESKLVELRGRIVQEVGIELADKTIKYNAIVNSISQGVVIKSRMGDIIENNKAARALIGDQAAKFGTTGLDAVMRDGEKIERADDPFTRALESGSKVENVVMGVTIDGEIVWVNVSAFPVSGQNILITIAAVNGDVVKSSSRPEASVKVTERQAPKVDEPAPVVKDEIDEENEMLFAMLNAMSDGQSTASTEEPIRYITFSTTKRGFSGSNANLLGSNTNIKEPTGPVYNGKILVVEDNPTCQKRMHKVLDKLHSDYLMVTSGEDAVKAIKSSGEYALVFLGEDAVKSAEVVRSSGHKLKIIGVLGNEATEKECRKMGIDEVVTKPVMIKSLIEQMDGWEMERKMSTQ